MDSSVPAQRDRVGGEMEVKSFNAQMYRKGGVVQVKDKNTTFAIFTILDTFTKLLKYYQHMSQVWKPPGLSSPRHAPYVQKVNTLAESSFSKLAPHF